jgi:hypothetical protein
MSANEVDGVEGNRIYVVGYSSRFLSLEQGPKTAALVIEMLELAPQYHAQMGDPVAPFKVLRFMNVKDLVEQILGALGPSGIIVELIIDDHSAPDMHLLGDDWIFGSASGQRTGRGYGQRYTDGMGQSSNMTKHPDLYRLNRRFHPKGVVTLQGCEVTAHRRTRLLELLSAWFGGVEVRAGDKESKPGLLGIEEGNHFTGCKIGRPIVCQPVVPTKFHRQMP